MDDATFARFMAKVKVMPNGCWIWQGKRGGNGYGYFWLNGKNRLAHKVAYEHFVGPIPAGRQVDHLCHTRDESCRGLGDQCPHRPCVNFADLEATTPRENVMRSTGLAAENAVKTTCKNGHDLTDGNTYLYPSGERGCRTCRAEAQRRFRDRHQPGRGIAARERTHCPQGHPYDEVNTRINSAGRRVCITCYRQRDRESKARKRAAARQAAAD